MSFIFRKLILLFGDILLLYVSLFLALFVGFWPQFEISVFIQHALPFSFLYFVWLLIFYVMDLYDLGLPTSIPFLSRFVLAMVVLLVTGIIFFYAASSGISPKTNLLIHVGVFGIFAYLWRLLFSTIISPLAPWRVGLYRLEEDGRALGSLIGSYSHQGYATVTLDTDKGLSDQITEHHLHTVILPSLFTSDQNSQVLYDCLGMPVTFLDVSQAFELFDRRIPLSTVDQHWFIQNLQEKKGLLYHRFKRVFDVAAAGLILIISFPFWLLIALLIKLEGGGEIFYTQERVGKHGKTFPIKKFRTMRRDAESLGVQWAQEADPRVTRVGRVLRATHLDELPQMLNVLKGDLSIVGPRPERPEFVRVLESEIPHYHVRHFIKPGFTGWAQIKFRYARSISDSKTKFEYDLYYIKNRSAMMDALILLKTIQLFFRRS